ncbi:MAG: hypothetical protein R8P61_11330 [Bacteroidia bacterium]|nr:hypothetical protein [Bacteroidia bacterium]
MKKNGLLICCLVSTCFLNSQNLLDTNKIPLNDSMALIGMFEPDRYTDNNSDQNSSFHLMGVDSIQKLLTSLEYGESVQPIYQAKPYYLKLISQGEVLIEWILQPNLGSVIIGFKHYAFDFGQLKLIASKNPFFYEYQELSFSSLKSYKKYITTIDRNKFQFTFNPFDKERHNPFGGQFKLVIAKNSKFPEPKVIADYISSEIQKIASRDSFKITYSANYHSGKEFNEFEFDVQSSEKLYRQISIPDFQRKEWIPVRIKVIRVKKIQ